MGIKTNNLEITGGGITLNGVNIFDKIYPIGSLYLSVTNTNPGTLFGGTWEQLKDKFLLGAGDTYVNGTTGGNSTHTHNLSSSNVQAHIEVENNTAEHIGYLWVDEKPTNGWTTNSRTKFGGQPVANTRTSSYGAGVSGVTNSSSNMPPYLVVYMWKRTA